MDLGATGREMMCLNLGVSGDKKELSEEEKAMYGELELPFTLSEDSENEHSPEHTYVWIPPASQTLFKPGSGEYYRHMADHPATSLFGDRTPVPRPGARLYQSRSQSRNRILLFIHP
jgi:hypothetical protein